MALLKKRSLTDIARDQFDFCHRMCEDVDPVSNYFDSPVGPCIERAEQHIRHKDVDRVNSAKGVTELLSVMQGESVKLLHAQYIFACSIRGAARQLGASYLTQAAGAAAARALEAMLVSVLFDTRHFEFIHNNGHFRLQELGFALHSNYFTFAAEVIEGIAALLEDSDKYATIVLTARTRMQRELPEIYRQCGQDPQALKMLDTYAKWLT